MKIPTQQNNVKRAALVVTGMAMVAGLAVPTVALAHGGGYGDRERSWHREDRRGGYDKSWAFGSWSLWQQISAEDFSNWNGAKLAKIDNYVVQNNLQVENGDTLRATVDTNATAVASNLTTLSELRDSIGDLKDATPEERTALKDQSTATFSAYYDYKLSLYDYTVAIKAAASNKGAAVDSSLEEGTQ